MTTRKLDTGTPDLIAQVRGHVATVTLNNPARRNALSAGMSQNLPALLDGVRALLSPQPLFIIATAYAVRLSYLALAQTLADRLADLGGHMETGEMAIAQDGSDRLLPTALYARWSAD